MSGWGKIPQKQSNNIIFNYSEDFPRLRATLAKLLLQNDTFAANFGDRAALYGRQGGGDKSSMFGGRFLAAVLEERPRDGS